MRAVFCFPTGGGWLEVDMTVGRDAPASYKQRILSRTQRYQPGDIDAVIEFREAMYGEKAFLASRGYLEWMFEHAPEGHEPSQLWLFRSGGKVEAQQAGLRAMVRIKGTLYSAMWASDLFVSPTYQLRGVGAVLAEVVAAETPVTLGIEVSDAAKRSFLRAGWTDLGVVPLYVRPLDFKSIVRSWKLRRAFLARGLHLVNRAFDAVALRTNKAFGYRLTPIERFDARSDELWEKVAPQYDVIGLRDQHTLNWRFADFPEPGFYQCAYAERRGKVIGYVVMRRGEHHHLASSHIVDFLCSPRHSVAVLLLCIEHAKRSGSEMLYCLHQRSRLNRAFVALGFVRRSSGWPMMVYAQNLEGEALAAVTNTQSWFVTSADSNIDHPREGTIFADS